jgi:hypothetical protein
MFPYSWHNFLFSFFQDSITPKKGHLSYQHLSTISEGICHFMQREFISSCGQYHMQDGQMAQYTELCDYSSEGHKMRNLMKFVIDRCMKFVIDRCMNLYVFKLRAFLNK